ncbi:MAG: HAD family hydrolase [Blautia sp.]|nr:HAD family hydrolase [Blautia sp.]MDY4516641.1 HAD family hydrolase [Lachnospiraceae bacterium]
MKKKYLLFDLDGTLTDSMEGITNSVKYALESYGIYERDMEKLVSFIGPPLVESFMAHYGFEREKAEEAVWKYREYFEKKGMYENAVYEGIPALLEKLKKEGRTLIVATSKPTGYSKQILAYFDLEKYFDDVQGSSMDGTRVRKEDVIRYTLDVNGIANTGQAVMIGDRKHDILGGRACGLDTIGVLYGFGSREELEAAGAGRIASDVEELGRLLEVV